MRVAIKESMRSPAQTHRPIAAVAHILAAVVSHLVLSHVFIIAPAPRKPIPDTTCAAILPGSLMFELYISGTSIERIMSIHEPSQIRIWVRTPAGWCLISLSSQSKKASQTLINIRMIMSLCDITSVGIKKMLINTLIISIP